MLEISKFIASFWENLKKSSKVIKNNILKG